MFRKAILYSVLVLGVVVPTHYIFAAPIELKLLVALINFTDFKTTPYTKASIEASTFGATNSIKQYYEDISNNKITFVGDVVDWTTVTRPNTDCTNLLSWEAAIKPVLSAKGININNYSYVMYMYPAVPCASAGTAWYGIAGYYPPHPSRPLNIGHIYGYNNSFVPVHELGHSIGMSHADSLACSNAQIELPANCTQTAYGDLSDVMGVGFSIGKPMMYNAPHLMTAKFLPPTASKLVSTSTMGSRSGVFTLNSLESNTGLRVLKIKKNDADNFYYYYLSMRQAIGIDSLMPATYLGGANVHISVDDTVGFLTIPTKIVSLTGKNSPKYTMSDGMTFSDPAGVGLVIKQLSHTASTVTLEVTFGKPAELPGCTPVAPTVSVTPATLSGAAGSALTYTVKVKNNDPAECPTGQFAFGKVVPAGWSTVNSVPSISVAPGQTSQATIAVYSPANAAANDYPVTFSVSDTLTTAHIASASTSYTVNPDACMRAVPLITSSPWFVKTTGPGVKAQYVVRVTQKDVGCPVSTYQFATSTLPAGWTSTLSLKSANLTVPDTYIDFILTVTSAAGSESGTTSVPLLVSDAATASHATSTQLKYIIPPSAGTCTRYDPLFSIAPLTKSGNAGDQLVYTASLTNRDTAPCSAANFTFLNLFNLGLPTDWITQLQQASLLLSPGVTGSTGVLITSPATTEVKSYPFTLSVNATSAGGTYVVTSSPPISPTDPVLPTQDTMSITASRVRKGTASTISWWVNPIASGVSCSITPSGLFSTGAKSISDATSWGTKASPMTAQTVFLTEPAIFRLSCTNGISAITKETVVPLVPTVNDL